jgi:hypothetical protein
MTIQVERHGDHVRIGAELVLRVVKTTAAPDDGQPHHRADHQGLLPLASVEDLAGLPPPGWAGEQPVLVVAPPGTAFWLEFEPRRPHAVQVSCGDRDAIVDAPWERGLRVPQNYIVCPPQCTVSGRIGGDGAVRQFVVGRGTVPADRQTIRLRVYPPRQGSPAWQWHLVDPRFIEYLPEPDGEMVGDGGVIDQALEPDPFGVSAWDADGATDVVLRFIPPEMRRS